MSGQSNSSYVKAKMLYKVVSCLIKQSLSNWGKMLSRVCRRKKFSQKCLIKDTHRENAPQN